MNTITKAGQHAWLYAVLIEMNDYCRNEGLNEVSATLEKAIEQMEPVVFPHPLPSRPADEAAPRPSAEVVRFPERR